MTTIEILSKVLLTESVWTLFLAAFASVAYKDASLQPPWLYRLGISSVAVTALTILFSAFYAIWYLL